MIKIPAREWKNFSDPADDEIWSAAAKPPRFAQAVLAHSLSKWRGCCFMLKKTAGLINAFLGMIKFLAVRLGNQGIQARKPVPESGFDHGFLL